MTLLSRVGGIRSPGHPRPSTGTSGEFENGRTPHRATGPAPRPRAAPRGLLRARVSSELGSPQTSGSPQSSDLLSAGLFRARVSSAPRLLRTRVSSKVGSPECGSPQSSGLHRAGVSSAPRLLRTRGLLAPVSSTRFSPSLRTQHARPRGTPGARRGRSDRNRER